MDIKKLEVSNDKSAFSVCSTTQEKSSWLRSSIGSVSSLLEESVILSGSFVSLLELPDLVVTLDPGLEVTLAALTFEPI